MNNKDNLSRIAYINGKFLPLKEADFWRKGIMKKLPVLLSLFIVMLIGMMLTFLLK